MRWTRAGILLAGLLLVALTATGAWLWWNYRPDRDQWVRTVHQVSAVVLLALAVALVIGAVVRRAVVGAPGVVAAAGVLATVGGAYVVGRLLPWDQVAFDAAGRPGFGVVVAFDDRTRFLVLQARTLAASTYRWWAYAHLGLAVLAVVALALQWARSGEPAVSRPAPAPAASREASPAAGASSAPES